MKKAFLALLVLGMSSSAFAGEWVIYCKPNPNGVKAQPGIPSTDSRPLDAQPAGTYILNDKTFDDSGEAMDFIRANYKLPDSNLVACPYPKADK